ncbi:hypothetical protein BDN72DRAFT_846980 [Pluteus cervinus]|uniref:Uncharacterized protein n=1 Tax=Pluteus cervinus TaxID=181527 RepID=A0ACD3AER9_9AGAR|nr:hypothetical protein BDN72DRAFT_846980 [Pluteus cervinus]
MAHATDSSTLPPLFQQIRDTDIHGLVSAYIQSNKDNPIVVAIVSLLDTIQSKSLPDLNRLVTELISTLSDRQFYIHLSRALWEHIQAHPYSTAFFIIGVVLTCVLMCHPLTMIGFGPMGIVAGSLAAAWQASMGGTVAAGSAFAILQSWGMTCNVIFPIAGSVIATVSTTLAAGAVEQIAKIAHDTGGRLNKVTTDTGANLMKVAYDPEEPLNKVTQHVGEHLARVAHDSQALANIVREELKKLLWPWWLTEA